MFLARIKKRITATEKHPAYQKKHVFVVQPVYPDGRDKGDEWVAVDYVGAGIGDIVVCGGAPGGVWLEAGAHPHTDYGNCGQNRLPGYIEYDH